ncbi:methylglyoxal reductase (NADPH-dependent) gre2 [Tulasnella sp. UAMH 9824]|nr:methylglyoxal reductase (NADPH-dependent) gre2 [Tulasnella sp. UAMH 9824]
MPAVLPPAKVLVTGASGFIGAWVAKALLERGFTVVGTVRSDLKGEYLRTLFKQYENRFTYVLVPDVGKRGAFDEAVVGVDAVAHVASPVSFSAGDPQELIGPAVSGTLSTLESVKAHGTSVRRVVITSSKASIVNDKPQAGWPTFDETDWNDVSPREIELRGKDAEPIHKYRASKVLAERAAWDFVENNKDSISFDLVTVLPSFVFGPIIHEVTSLASLNLSIQQFHDYTTHHEPPTPAGKLTGPPMDMVDVRDTALIHVLALETPEAGSERFIASAAGFTPQVLLDAAHASGPRDDVPRGNPGTGTVQPMALGGKAERAFGIKYRPVQETVLDTLNSLREKGW